MGRNKPWTLRTVNKTLFCNISIEVCLSILIRQILKDHGWYFAQVGGIITEVELEIHCVLGNHSSLS